MVKELAHARIIAAFGDIFELCGKIRDVLATTHGRLEQQGFKQLGMGNAYRKVAELENAATVLLRDYVAWASPLDVSGEGDRMQEGGGH